MIPIIGSSPFFILLSFSVFFFFSFFVFSFIFYFSSLQQNGSKYHFQPLCVRFRVIGTTFEKKTLHPPSCFQDGRHPFLKLVCVLSLVQFNKKCTIRR